MEKHLQKGVFGFWWCYRDCASITAELCEEFNTMVLLNIYFSISPPSYYENGRFYDTLPFCFFMEKCLLKPVVHFRWCDQDWASFVAELCKEFNAKVLLNIYFSILAPPSFRENIWVYDTRPFSFLIKKEKKLKREVIKSFILRLCTLFISRKCLFWLISPAYFKKVTWTLKFNARKAGYSQNSMLNIKSIDTREW